jgi:hypothetical protein
VRNRSMLRKVDEEGRKIRASKYGQVDREGRVDADVTLSSAELYMDVFQHQLLALAARKHLDEDRLTEAGKKLLLLWMGRGGLFVRQGRVRTRLQPVDCTLWLTLAVCRLLSVPVSAAELHTLAMSGAVPFRNALQWERERLRSETPVVVDNSDLLGLFKSIPDERPRVFVPSRARELYGAMHLRPVAIIAGMEGVLELCGLRVPLPLHASILWGAQQVLETLPPWSDTVAAAAMHFVETWDEHVLAAAVGTCLLRSLSLSDATVEELAAFVGRTNRPLERVEMRANGVPLVTRQLLDSLELVAPPAPAEDAIESDRPPRRIPTAAFPEAPVLQRRDAKTTLPSDAVFANVMGRVCGCWAHEVWPCLDALERRLGVRPGGTEMKKAQKRARKEDA